jgi:hypothetical protein
LITDEKAIESTLEDEELIEILDSMENVEADLENYK